MTRQRFGGLTFERPITWKEKPSLAYDVAGACFGEHASSVVVSVERRAPSDTVVGHVRRLAGRLARELTTNKIDAVCILVGTEPGVRLRVEWQGDNGTIVKNVAYVANPHDERELLVFTLVAGARGPAPSAVSEFERMLATVTFDPALDEVPIDSTEPITLRTAALEALPLIG